MKEPIYINLANQLAAMIEKGIYKPGEKLPSLRSIHKQKGISIGTVLQAFIHLHDKGLVTPHEKSGYFVNYLTEAPLPLPETIPASLGTHAIHIDRLLQKLRKEQPNKQFISFANALPDHRLLPFNGIKRAIQTISRDTSGSYLMMEESRGNKKLRQVIARRAFAWGGNLHMDDVVVTNGATEAINLCLKAVTQPGDTVLIQSPCYYGVMQSLEFLNLKAVVIPSDPENGIRINDLENACSKVNVKACLLVSNFNNPDGASLTTLQKKQIAAFAAKFKIPVIEDDIYGDLAFQRQRPDTIKTYDKAGWVMLCNSFSKTLFPGFRIGWCAPGRFAYEVQRFKSMSNISTCNFTQKSLHMLLDSGMYDRHLQKFTIELEKNMLRYTQCITQYFPAGTKITRPAGGLVLWAELPAKIDAVALQDAAFEQGIGLAPGEIFSTNSSYKNYIRLSYSQVWNPRMEKALQKLGRLCESLVPQEAV